MKNNFLQEMQKRGYLNQCTNLEELSKFCNKNPISGYIGFDCTASSLHVGSLLQIMIFKLMQKHGHRPIVLLGGGTTLIGDPSGKDTTRKMLDNEEIKKNIENLSTQKNQLEIEKIELEEKYKSLANDYNDLTKKLDNFKDKEKLEQKKQLEFSEKIDELNQETDTLLNEIDKWQT